MTHQPETSDKYDKYNNPKLSATAQSWLELTHEEAAVLLRAGLTRSYLSNMKAGRSRPHPKIMGKVLDAMNLHSKTTANKLLYNYMLDICPSAHTRIFSQLIENDKFNIEKNKKKTPSLETNPYQQALDNLRAYAKKDALIEKIIILLSKHI
jgi:hypothetical protein